MCHLALAELERDEAPALIEFLTPLCKIYATEAGIRAADLGIQILGGYGYLEEYGMAQVWRDARITSIYEGANGIHALTLATRGLKLEGGAAIGQFAALVTRLGGAEPGLVVDCEAWQAHASGLAESPDVRAEAHGFAQETAALLARAVRLRLAAG